MKKEKICFIRRFTFFCYECKHKIGVRGKKMVITIWYVTIIAEIQN